MARFGQWIVDNKEWLFSGAGLVLLASLGRVVYRRKKACPSQKIRSGSNSTNVQVGHDMHIKSKTARNDAKEE
jgi:LPXTG-motif cell wall-anchored protein